MRLPRVTIDRLMLLVLLVAVVLGAVEEHRRRERERALTMELLGLTMQHVAHQQAQAVAVWLSERPPEPLPVLPAPTPPSRWFITEGQAEPPAPK